MPLQVVMFTALIISQIALSSSIEIMKNANETGAATLAFAASAYKDFIQQNDATDHECKIVHDIVNILNPYRPAGDTDCMTGNMTIRRCRGSPAKCSNVSY